MSETPVPTEYNAHSIRHFSAAATAEAHHLALDGGVAESLDSYLRRIINKTPGRLQAETAETFVVDTARHDTEIPLYSGRAYNYPAISEIDPDHPKRTTESTIQSATENMHRLVGRFGLQPFAAGLAHRRRARSIEWQAPIDDDFAIRVRGASGASAFSLDLGVGMLDRSKEIEGYNELWRTGIDTEGLEDGPLGTRFIRTGTAVKIQPDQRADAKYQSFREFRNRYGMLPRRMLALTGLYVMRELKPDYAVALTEEGAINYSTLGHSKGVGAYDETFRDIGFRAACDPNWSVIHDFPNGFYEALDRADMRRKEVDALSLAIDAIHRIKPVTINEEDAPVMPLQLCTDDSRETIEREWQLHMPPNLFRPSNGK